MYGPTTARPISFFDPPSLGTVYTDNMKLTRSRHVGRMVKTNASLYTGNEVFLLITVFRFFKVFPPIIMDTLTYGSERMRLFTSMFFGFGKKKICSFPGSERGYSPKSVPSPFIFKSLALRTATVSLHAVGRN